jgi:hypothetical protein
MGVMDVACHWEGTKPISIQSLKSCASGSQSSRRADLSRVALIPSGPGELVLSSLRLARTFAGVKMGEEGGWHVAVVYAERSGWAMPLHTL